MIVFDSDDFGANHVISDMCQAHDCRDALTRLRLHNPNFKATLFAIPGEMTPELQEWAGNNRDWIELAVHGFFHSSNYECEKMTLEEFSWHMERFKPMIEASFVRGFKAPGWQISDDCYLWLQDNGWWVADQAYNNERRPGGFPVYLNNNGQFSAWPRVGNPVEISNGIHTHTWNCVGNGIYELEDQLKQQISQEVEFKFVSEVLI